MITPSQIREIVNATAQSGGLHEREDRLDVNGNVSLELLEQWRKVASEGNAFGTFFALNDVDDPVDLLTNQDVDLENQHLRITIRKPVFDNVVYLFTKEGLHSVLARPGYMANVKTVLIAEEFAEFSTETCSFVRWKDVIKLEDKKDDPVQFAPRRVVKDLGGGEVPVSLGPFLLKSELPDASGVFDIWKAVVCKYLFLSLVNEAWHEGGRFYVTLVGLRKKKVEFDPARVNKVRDFVALTDCARWVYASGRDVEVRHTLFTYELAREWPEECTLTEGFAVRSQFALDSAKTSFLAHVRETSKDTLKSLSDLRKALGEDVGKITQQTRDALSALWKDFAIAVTALFGKVALSSARTSANPTAVKIALLGTAVFLGGSFINSLIANHRFSMITKTNRATWRRKLYGFLPEDDLQALLDQPLDDSERVYRHTIIVIGVAYLAICLALVWAAFT
jgi:hypothetical protein